MTDITELAQSLKAAAIDAKELAIIARYSKGRAAAEKFYAMANPANILALVEALEKAQGMEAYWKTQCRGITDHCEELQARIAELEREQEQLRPVGVMSEKAFHRLENSECRFIALWPRPGIFLPRKRPEDGVIVYARTVATAGIKVEAD
ncbi:hypothetical protein [Klebsiella variicola]|uniref:hypothetical protein n=1 Tax=Klebsiella variicola TaxID=244366 RepID=UPI00190E892E|nr:hypothetical protein [Klebsiella variicola]HCA9582210.1 hypothetical protein [Klebsiella pneumoniae]